MDWERGRKLGKIEYRIGGENWLALKAKYLIFLVISYRALHLQSVTELLDYNFHLQVAVITEINLYTFW